jgi:hypothetical protein
MGKPGDPDGSVTDNTIGLYKFFGIVEMAATVKSNSDSPVAGDPLTVNVSGQFDGIVNSNEIIPAMYLDRQTNLTNVRTMRVFLHNGFLPAPPGSRAAGATAYS